MMATSRLSYHLSRDSSGAGPHRHGRDPRPVHRLRARPRALAAGAGRRARSQPDVGADQAGGGAGGARRSPVRDHLRQLPAPRRARRLPAVPAHHVRDGRPRAPAAAQTGGARVQRAPRRRVPAADRADRRAAPRRSPRPCRGRLGRPAEPLRPAAADGGHLRAGRRAGARPAALARLRRHDRGGRGTGVRRGHPGHHRRRQGGCRAPPPRARRRPAVRPHPGPGRARRPARRHRVGHAGLAPRARGPDAHQPRRQRRGRPARPSGRAGRAARGPGAHAPGGGGADPLVRPQPADNPPLRARGRRPVRAPGAQGRDGDRGAGRRQP